MSNELKPCQFCGVPESDETVNFDHHKDDCYLKMTLNSVYKAVWRFASEIQRAGFFDDELYTPAQIHEAWNTRAERTCEIARVETGEPAEYDCDEVLWHCESCHEEVAIYAYNENGDTWADKPAFCPDCGAKVVE